MVATANRKCIDDSIDIIKIIKISFFDLREVAMSLIDQRVGYRESARGTEERQRGGGGVCRPVSNSCQP